MGKKKDSPALFELITKARSKGDNGLFAVPSWMADKAQATSAPATAPPPPPVAEKPASRPVAVPSTVAAPSPPKPAVAAPRPVAPRPVVPRPAATRPAVPRPIGEKAVIKQGQKLRVSLSQWHCIVLGVVLVVALAGVFWLGRAAWTSASSKRATPASGGEARAATKDLSPVRREASRQPAPPRPAAANTTEPPPAAQGQVPAGEPVRVKGKYYLIVQGLKGTTPQHRRDAEEIIAFLSSKGEKVTLNRYTGSPPQYIVLSLTGFDSPDTKDAKGYLKTVEALGRRYVDQGGKYNFSQGEDGWFVRW